ncbi:TKL/LISK protein kinase [Thecamonas trahens ATCC 50062]|uniref:TKL/LISK protein kinase n=1 Tax=Thecamonas trahens ATCC 50062 TaxID=461836 RepID=A0A0L0D5E9_THETB|nr:TKL/LISK protein kinase [Thecamonas trahens ATCC 50062]KNC47587.1 TKL/LISK protein kinase [Thecamonas trahens ATCC 50062]|eukprot:XP_013759517.1 TKL/LISK protein kinase [Thecamonas trahens ATCC 50062]
MCDASHPEIAPALQRVADALSGYVVLGYHKKKVLHVLAEGSETVPPLDEVLLPGVCAWVFLALRPLPDPQPHRHLLVAWSGPRASVVARASMAAHKASINAVIPSTPAPHGFVRASRRDHYALDALLTAAAAIHFTPTRRSSVAALPGASVTRPPRPASFALPALPEKPRPGSAPPASPAPKPERKPKPQLPPARPRSRPRPVSVAHASNIIAGRNLTKAAPPVARRLNSPRSSRRRVAKPRARLDSNARRERRATASATNSPEQPVEPRLPTPPPSPQSPMLPDLATPTLSSFDDESSLVGQELGIVRELRDPATVAQTLADAVAVLEWSHRVLEANLASAGNEVAIDAKARAKHLGLYDGIYDGQWLCLAAPLEALTSWMSPQDGDAEGNSQIGLLTPDETLAFYSQLMEVLELPKQLVFEPVALLERRDVPGVLATLRTLGKLLEEPLFAAPPPTYPYQAEQALLVYWAHREALLAAERGGPVGELDEAWVSDADAASAFLRLSHSEAAVTLDGDSMAVMARSWLEPRYFLDPAKLEMGHELGEGAFGQVYAAVYEGSVTAVKEITVNDAELPPFVIKAFLKLIVREVRLLQELRHPNVLSFVGAVFPDDGGLSFRLVTEFMARDTVRKQLDDYGHSLGWHIRLRMAADSARGMAYLHTQNILHRDLKSENLFISQEWRTKLGDFGFARVAATTKEVTAAPEPAAPDRSRSRSRSRSRRSRSRIDRSRMTICGTEDFMAPELRMGKAYDSTADVFSFGIVLFEILTGLQADDPPLARDRGSEYTLDYSLLRAYVPASVPPALLELAIAATAPDADARPSMANILYELEAARAARYGPTPWPKLVSELLASDLEATVDDALASLAAAEDAWFVNLVAKLGEAPEADQLNVDGGRLYPLPYNPDDAPTTGPPPALPPKRAKEPRVRRRHSHRKSRRRRSRRG